MTLNELNTRIHKIDKRRNELIKNMSVLQAEGINCSKCSGDCCTFKSNSMQITPLEALDLYLYLRENNRINSELTELLFSTAESNRLDSRLPNQNGGFVRKTYSCPFYLHHNLGCSISRNSKPYGCLAFNAYENGQSKLDRCASDQGLLTEREDAFYEEEKIQNEHLKSLLGIFWDKAPIPIALLEFIQIID